MALPYDPNFSMAIRPPLLKIKKDRKHDPTVSAAMVAVNLISTARLALELDDEYTEYSSQYLVDIARSLSKGGKDLELTVRHLLKFALNKGIPKAEDWTGMGSTSKSPTTSLKPALVSMKGDVIETKDMDEARELLKYQPLGAKLHVFSPQIDLVGDGIYCGSSGEETGYVGLRDVIIVRVEKIHGKSIATVKMWYKKKFKYVKVSLSRMFFLKTALLPRREHCCLLTLLSHAYPSKRLCLNNKY